MSIFPRMFQDPDSGGRVQTIRDCHPWCVRLRPTLGAKPRQLCPGKRQTRHSPGGNAGQDAVFSPEVWAVAWSLREAPARLPWGTGPAGRLASLPRSVCLQCDFPGSPEKETPRSPHVCDARSKEDPCICLLLEEGRRCDPLGAWRRWPSHFLCAPRSRLVPRESARPRFRLLGLRVPSKSHHIATLSAFLNVFGDKKHRQTLVMASQDSVWRRFLSALGLGAEVRWGPVSLPASFPQDKKDQLRKLIESSRNRRVKPPNDH